MACHTPAGVHVPSRKSHRHRLNHLSLYVLQLNAEYMNIFVEIRIRGIPKYREQSAPAI
jgi:hypothetical protein